MFRIKICGLTTPDDALAAVEAGADALGLNFYAKSPRFVSAEAARAITAAVGARALKVGLFVNTSAAEIRATCDAIGLDAVQLHGDEPPDLLRHLESRPVIKAFRIGADGLAPVRSWLEACLRLSVAPRMVLLDGFEPGEYGGTGRRADWTAASTYAGTAGVPRLVLAGGLTAENVAEAVAAVHPWAVDTASGVESAPGRKDPVKTARFVAAARAAFGP